jgi:D-glycero-alpha-D-manno-heptose-7-phosphate kinase
MIISRTPLRVSFVGGGTDLPAFCDKDRGAVVSTAIKKYVYVIIHPSFDKKNKIAYSKIEVTDKVDEIMNTRVREAMKMTGVTKGIEIHSVAEVPSGTGLGSSSSFTVGLLNALYAYQGKHVSAERLAKEASEIEISILQEPIGRQDQFAAAFGGLNKIEFIGKDVKIRPLIFDLKIKKELENKLLLFYLGKEERSASQILKNQGDNLNENCSLLSHYIRMRDLADEMEESLRSNKIEGFGELLHKNWLLKQNLSKDISNEQINNFYSKALSAGATGGKILGAGGSGFLLIYADEEKQNAVRKALEELREYELNFDNEGSRIIYIGQ